MRPIDADALLNDSSIVYHTEFGDAVVDVEDIKKAPTIKTFTLADIEAQYRNGLEKGLEESLEERENIISWLSKFCLHIDMADKHLSDAEALEFWKKKMKVQFGWKEGDEK